ncbi:MAG: hypothetical protein U0324_47570, partial [Polyangiales bacterium]
VRYHGVFAPNSPWRAVVVPGVTRAARGCEGSSVRLPAIASPKHGALADVALAEPREGACRAQGTAGRIDWATLMHRVWGWDVLACPRCDSRMKFIAVIKDCEVIVRILTHGGLPAARVSTAPERRWDDTS